MHLCIFGQFIGRCGIHCISFFTLLQSCCSQFCKNEFYTISHSKCKCAAFTSVLVLLLAHLCLFEGFILMATKRNSVLLLAGRTVVDGGQPLLKPCLADHITLRVDSSSENKTQLQGPNPLGSAKFSLGMKGGKKGGGLTKSASWLRQLRCKECKKARETES